MRLFDGGTSTCALRPSTGPGTSRALTRHRWVYLGSRFQAPREGEPEVFVADLEQNLICLSFFFQGNTLLTAARPECEAQTIWIANSSR